MTTRTAACSCGQLRLTCTGEPVRISICHCLDCQKRTGSVFAVQARFAARDVTIAGASAQWARTGDSDATATFHRCPSCGAIVYWEMSAFPGFLAVPVGAFADPTFPAPSVSVYEARQHGWTLALGELELAHYD